MNNSSKFAFIGVITFTLLLFANSCKTQDNAQTTDDQTEVIQERIIGIVRLSDECGFYIEGTNPDTTGLFYPENLEEKFQVEGMKLKFGYKESSIKPEKKCMQYKPILLSDVTVMR